MRYLLLFIVNIHFVLTNDISEKLKEFGIMPDVIDVAPEKSIEISYTGGINVEFGNELTPTQVKDEPEVQFEAEPEEYYLLVMADPDAPSRKKAKDQVKHWLVGNIPGNDVKKGEILAEYRGSGAPKGTGLHRYVFLVFKQNGKISFGEKKIPSNVRGERGGFSSRKFAEKYNLGNPVASNFFQAQYDSYVEILKQNTVA